MSIRVTICLVAVLILNMGSVTAATTVNINSATIKDLTGLVPGLGPIKAKAIVDYRASHGPFKSLEDLKQVHGVGNKLLDELSHYVQFTAIDTALGNQSTSSATTNLSKTAGGSRP